jgi:hypothetical protein
LKWRSGDKFKRLGKLADTNFHKILPKNLEYEICPKTLAATEIREPGAIL